MIPVVNIKTTVTCIFRYRFYLTSLRSNVSTNGVSALLTARLGHGGGGDCGSCSCRRPVGRSWAARAALRQLQGVMVARAGRGSGATSCSMQRPRHAPCGLGTGSAHQPSVMQSGLCKPCGTGPVKNCSRRCRNDTETTSIFSFRRRFRRHFSLRGGSSPSPHEPRRGTASARASCVRKDRRNEMEDVCKVTQVQLGSGLRSSK